MKLYKKLCAFLMVIPLVLTGCASVSLQQEGSIVTAPTAQFEQGVDTLIIVAPQDVAEMLQPLFTLYETSQGVSVTVNTVPQEDFDEQFATASASQGAALVVSDSAAAINGGSTLDLTTASSPLVSAIAGAVPEYLRRSPEVYFMPAGIDGYAYIANIELLSQMLALDADAVPELSENLRQTSGIQWQSSTEQLYDVITGATSTEETLRFSTAEYTLSPDTLGEEQNVVTPFALAIGDNQNFLQPLSPALLAHSQNEDSTLLLTSYIAFLETESAMLAATDGEVLRGEDFTDNYGELDNETAAALFSQDKVLFWRTSLSQAHRLLPTDTAAVAPIFPLKLPFDSETFEDSTLAYSLNAGITVTTPFGFGLLGSGTNEQQAAALDFLVWFYYSVSGKSYITDTLGLIDFNTMTATTPFSKQLLQYINNENYIADELLFLPFDTKTAVATLIGDDYMTDTTWSAAETEQLATDLAVALGWQTPTETV